MNHCDEHFNQHCDQHYWSAIRLALWSALYSALWSVLFISNLISTLISTVISSVISTVMKKCNFSKYVPREFRKNHWSWIQSWIFFLEFADFDSYRISRDETNHLNSWSNARIVSFEYRIKYYYWRITCFHQSRFILKL